MYSIARSGRHHKYLSAPADLYYYFLYFLTHLHMKFLPQQVPSEYDAATAMPFIVYLHDIQFYCWFLTSTFNILLLYFNIIYALWKNAIQMKLTYFLIFSLCHWWSYWPNVALLYVYYLLSLSLKFGCVFWCLPCFSSVVVLFLNHYSNNFLMYRM